MSVTWTEVSADPGVDFTNYGNGSTITFTSVNGGANIPSGVKFVMFVATHDSTTAITAQIGSQSLANAVEDSGGNNSVFWVDLASAQTDTMTLSSCPAVQSISVLAGWLSNAAAGAPSFIGSSAAGAQQFATISLTIPNGGMAVGGMWEYNGTTSPTWSNMTQANFVSNAGPNKGQGSAFSAAGTGAAVTIGVSGGSSAFGTSFVGASWAAGAAAGNVPYNPWPQAAPILAT